MLRLILPEEQIGNALNGHKYRKRVFDPVETIYLFLTQTLNQDQPCRETVARHFAARLSNGQKPISTLSGGYCQARRRLPLGVMSKLAKDVASAIVPKELWKGRHVKMVDGSTVSMPDTPTLQAAYPQPKTQTQGCGFPLARIIGIFSLATGAVTDFAMGSYKGKGTGEATMFYKLNLNPGDLVLGDRLFDSYPTIAFLLRSNCDFVVRMNARRGAYADNIVSFPKPAVCPKSMDWCGFAALPDQIEVRQLRADVPVMCTYVMDATPAELAELYRERWKVEQGFRSIKSDLHLDYLRCTTPDLIHKEFAAHMLAYNLLRKIICEAAADRHPNEISLKGCSQILLAFLNNPDFYEQMLAAVGSHVVGQRPGRSEPRVRKRRPKSYPLMTRPRGVA